MQARDDRTAGSSMSKRPKPVTQRPQPQLQPVEPAPSRPVEREIEVHRRCPVCWNGRGGYGVAYSTQGSVRYYKCCRSRLPDGLGPCGHTWSVRVVMSSVVVESRQVFMDGQR